MKASLGRQLCRQCRWRKEYQHLPSEYLRSSVNYPRRQLEHGGLWGTQAECRKTKVAPQPLLGLLSLVLSDSAVQSICGSQRRAGLSRKKHDLRSRHDARTTRTTTKQRPNGHATIHSTTMRLQPQIPAISGGTLHTAMVVSLSRVDPGMAPRP